MKKHLLGMNTGCLINRHVEPEDWAKLVGETFDLRYVQLTTELLRPDLSWQTHQKLVSRIRTACAQHRVQVLEVFTDAFSRVNHLGHPIEEVREHWLQWMKRACELAVELGAQSFGSHLGILTAADCADAKKREQRTQQVVEGWNELSEHAKKIGLEFLTWEPMSIRREFGETVEAAAILQRRLNESSALPIRMCYDVDHGDIQSPRPEDTDPYAWLTRFGSDFGSIHLKQTGKNKEGHRPFTPEFNATGRIEASAFMTALEKLPEGQRVFLELSFKEREPADSSLVSQVRASVDYWRPHFS